MLRQILILGCGYLGTRLIKAAEGLNLTIDALSRNAETCRSLKQSSAANILHYNLADPEWHKQVNPRDYAAVILCVGSAQSNPQGYRESYLEGTQSLINWAADAFEGHLIYTSSISVYGDADGAWVDESTPPSPENWRGEIILKSEQLLLRAFPNQSLIFRLGGLYGPGRNRFLRSRRQASPDPSTDPYLNLIHLHDAADALLNAIRFPAIHHRLYNLTDNHPVKRSELRKFLQIHNPTTQNQEESVSTRTNGAPSPNRRVRSSLICEDMNWKPAHPSVFDAIPHMV